MNLIKIISIALLSVTLFSNPAYAYLDPGTGSMIVQMIIGVIAGASVAIGAFWGKIMAFFNSFRNKKS